MNYFLVVLAVLALLLAIPLHGAVVVPEYSQPQLQDKNYVQSEIERLSRLRDEVSAQRETASEIVQMVIDKDLKKIDVTLDALRYVEANGYDPADPELKKMEFFQGSVNGAAEGFHHDMKALGPPGGRVSYLDHKSTSRTDAKVTRPPATPKRKSYVRPNTRKRR